MASDTLDRVYLCVPYHEREAAKGLGARWDVITRKWWATRWAVAANPGLHRWLEAGSSLAKQAKAAAAFLMGPTAEKTVKRKQAVRLSRSSSGPAMTQRTDFSLPTCSCAVPPWEHCGHTAG